MGVYLYAICGDDAAVPDDVSGFDGAPLRMVRAGGLAALVSDRSSAPPEPREDTLWEHERVVEALMAGHDLLPARFGTELDSDAAVAELVLSRAEEFRSALAYVAGAAELGVRAACVGDLAPSIRRLPEAHAGHGYLAQRIGVHQRVRALADRVEQALGPLARAHTIRMPAPTSATISAAFLVAHERIDEFAHRAAALDAEIVDGRVFCTGPWPPYSFSNAAGRGR